MPDILGLLLHACESHVTYKACNSHLQSQLNSIKSMGYFRLKSGIVEMLIFKIAILILICFENVVCNSDWSYANITAWKENYPECGGVHQSPIELKKR